MAHVDDNIQWQMHEQNRALMKYKQLLAVKEKEREKHKQAIDRLYEMREEDNIDKSSFIERKKVRDEQIQALSNKLII